MSGRNCELINVVGVNGTGKSTLVHEVVTGYVRKGGRALVVDMNGTTKQWRSYDPIDVSDAEDMKSFKGIRKTWYIHHEENTIPHILKHYRGGMLVFEDCRNYLNSQTPQVLKRLLIQYRHLELDIVAVAHHIDDIPNQLWGHATRVILQKTSFKGKKLREIGDDGTIEAALQEARNRWAARKGEENVNPVMVEL